MYLVTKSIDQSINRNNNHTKTLNLSQETRKKSALMLWWYNRVIPNVLFISTSTTTQNSMKFQTCYYRDLWHFLYKVNIKSSFLIFVGLNPECHSIKWLLITYLIPFDHSCLFSRVSTRTSGVPICFIANLRISFTARGARFLNPTPWSLLCKLIVYSRVTTSLIADLFFFSPLGFAIFTYNKEESMCTTHK